MNIYDFAGNEYEWTLEHATSSVDYPCSFRGGGGNNDGYATPASRRDNQFATYNGIRNGFRSALY